VSEATPYTMHCDGDLNGYWVHVYDHDPARPVDFCFTDRTCAVDWLETKGREIFGAMIQVPQVETTKGAA
jgi:hypothetical protein